jgi:carbon monoxide dehydrogenase subunit G
MEFETRFLVDAAPESVWEFLWNVERLAVCVPGCEDVEAADAGRRYRARLGDRIGPFRVAFVVAIEVTRADPPHRLTAAVTGEDEHLGSRVRGTLDASLVQVATSTELTLRTTVDVLGHVATLGHSAIRRRVQERFTEMEKRIRAALGPGVGSPAV